MAAQNLKVLVVDDDAFVREMLADILQSGGYDVETAENGVDALKKYATDPSIGLITSDMDMPEMNGLDLIKALRNNKWEVPVIFLTGNDQIAVAIEALNSRANDYLLKDEHIQDTILISVEKVLEKQRLKEQNRQLMIDLATKNKELESFNDTLKSTINTLTHIGTALSSERNLNKLLAMIVNESRNATHADGGTLYILEDNQLNFKIVQNKSKNIFMGGASQDPVTFPPVPLIESNVSAYCALKKEIVNIPDVYMREDFDFSGPKKFDAATGYKTKSMLVLPMLDRTSAVVGVLQLINATDPKTGEIVEFSENQVEIVHSLASQAGVAIENARSYEKIERKNAAFERFVPKEFLRYLGKVEVEEIHLGDASREEMSVLFSDIRSFTKISETLTPEENFLFLNDYLKWIGPIIEGQGGFIDKYIGDAILALFSGNRIGVADDAVAAAVGMLEKLREYNVHRKKIGFEPIAIGVGIHTGQLRLGTIGFEKRMETTVVGDTVNLASRVEGLTKRYGTPVIITASTFQRLVDPTSLWVREIDTVQVPGRERATVIYEVFNGDPESLREKKLRTLSKYQEGLILYKQRKWQLALQIFSELHADLKTDRVLEIYLERCREFQNRPPEESWEGITRLDEK